MRRYTDGHDRHSGRPDIGKVWRDVKRTVIDFSLERQTGRPGEVITLNLESRARGEIKMRLRTSEDVRVDDPRITLKGGRASVLMTPMLPGSFKVTLEFVDRTPNRYVVRRGRKVLVYEGTPLEIAQLRVKW